MNVSGAPTRAIPLGDAIASPAIHTDEVTSDHRAGAMTKLVRSAVLTVASLLFPSGAALAQAVAARPSLTAGFVLPINFHDIGRNSDSDSLGIDAGLWGEASFPLSATMSFQTGIDFPATPFQMTRDVPGSTGFRADIRHRDIVLNELLVFRPRSAGRAHPEALVGIALVFARTVQDVTSTALRPGPPPETSTVVHTAFFPAITGGLDWPIQLSQNLSLVPRVRVRVVLKDGNQFYPFSRVGISPGIGIRFGF